MSRKKMVLVKFDDNYADEFDVEGFRVMSAQEWNDYVKKIEACKNWPQSKYFGTNEGCEWDCFEDYLSCFKIKPLTPGQARTIKESIGESFGFMLMLDDRDLSRVRALY